MMQSLIGLADWPALLWGGVIAALVFVSGTTAATVLAAIVLVKMPATYFCDHDRRDMPTNRHPLWRWTLRVLKNLAGAAIIVLGAVLSVPGIPGPGLLMILFGITLLDFPGKRRLERWLVGRPIILNSINRLRRRYGKPPIILEPVEMKTG